MKKLLLIIFAALPAFGQINHYVSSTGDVSLTAATTAATLQQPANTSGASPAKNVTLEWATAYCSVACTVTQSINGTGATATAGTPVGVPGNTTAAAVATFWTASNAGAGTTIAIDHIPAGGTFTFDLSKVRLPSFGIGSNYTISISSITGTANVKIAHGEQQ